MTDRLRAGLLLRGTMARLAHDDLAVGAPVEMGEGLADCTLLMKASHGEFFQVCQGRVCFDGQAINILREGGSELRRPTHPWGDLTRAAFARRS
jgi:hypothetical protein